MSHVLDVGMVCEMEGVVLAVGTSQAYQKGHFEERELKLSEKRAS